MWRGKRNFFKFTWWPRKRLSSKKPKFVAKRWWPTPHLTNKKRKLCCTMCTPSSFKILMNWTDAHSFLGLRRAFAEEAKPRTYGDLFLPKERWSVILVKWWERLRLLFFFQAEDGIRDRSPSRGLGDVYKRQIWNRYTLPLHTQTRFQVHLDYTWVI